MSLHRQRRTLTALLSTSVRLNSSTVIDNNTNNNNLFFSPDRLLSPSHRAHCLAHLHSVPSLRGSRSNRPYRAAAVLVPIAVDAAGRVCLLFTKRAGGLRNHSGEVSFPGGVTDEADGGDPVVTALRETEEELGIRAEDLDVWGTMGQIEDRTGSTSVTPVIAQIKISPLDLSRLTLNPKEVASAFVTSVEELSTSGRYTQFRVRDNKVGYSLPVFDVEPHRIWGMTAIVTFQFMSAFVGRERYKHGLNYQSPMTK